MPTTWPVPNSEDIRDLVTHFSGIEGSALQALQTIQEKYGHVPDSALDTVADICNLSRAEVYGVFTFYSDFRTAAPAPNVVRVCVAEACQASGSAELVSTLKSEMGLDVHTKSRNGDVEASAVFCLGNCALGPAALVNEHLLGRATTAKIQALLGGKK